MDDFVSIFMKSLKALGKSPVLLLAGFAVGVLALPLLAGYGGLGETIRSVGVDFSQLLVPLVILPFITGGALGYAVEVREKGSSSLNTFISSAARYYPKMLVCGIIAFTVYYFLLTGILVFLLAGTIDPFLGSMLGFLTLALTFFILMSIEFYDISIVTEGSGIIAAFKNSIDFARKNLWTVVAFFVLALVLKALIQLPLTFGMAGTMMTNETYYNALLAASNVSVNATNSSLAASNSSINMTSLLSMDTITMSPAALGAVAVFQVLLQGFVFALLALFKADLYLTVKNRKRITDFDYDFSDGKAP
jgi:hypothetical protein